MSAIAVNGRRPRAVPASIAERPQSLAQALLAFAAEAPKLRRDATGQIQSRTYGYSTLDGMLDDVVPLLVKFDLLWTAKATVDAHGQPAALYRMTHVASDEFDEWSGPLPCAALTPQNLGSAITYMRRYTLVAYLNLAPASDDDGGAASVRPFDKYASTAASTIAPTSSPDPNIASPEQRADITAAASSAELTPAELANIILHASGSHSRIWKAPGEAEEWIARALARLPAEHVRAVLDGIAGASITGVAGGRHA